MHLISLQKTLPGPQLKATLFRWKSHEQKQMDFRLKKLKRGHGGLNMGLCPGPYLGDIMPDNAIHIAEDPFWFLEPAILRHSLYTRSHHYGVAEVSCKEWGRILEEWKELQRLLLKAQIPLDIPVLREAPRYARKAFVRDFRRNCAGLAKMIGLLENWFGAELESNDQVFIAGI
jgi:hypothetical protein